jgi:hypothetical protein
MRDSVVASRGVFPAHEHVLADVLLETRWRSLFIHSSASRVNVHRSVTSQDREL